MREHSKRSTKTSAKAESTARSLDRPGREAPGPKAPYARPCLSRFGDIRDVTLGSSPGLGESGNPTVFRP